MKIEKALPSTRIEVYKDEDKKWRWRAISKSEIRASSPQGYVSKQGCLIALKRLRNLMAEAEQLEV